MIEEHVDFTSHDPVKWTRVYRQGFMINLAYFTGLVACARATPPADIIACVPRECFEEFKNYVHAMALSEQDDSFTMVKGGDMPFGVSEVKRLAAWLNEHPDARPSPE